MRESIGIIQANGRRAVIPTLAYSATLFFYAAAAADHPPTHGGDAADLSAEPRRRDLASAEGMVRLLDEHQRAHPGKKWNASDKAAFKMVELLRASSHPEADAVVEASASTHSGS